MFFKFFYNISWFLLQRDRRYGIMLPNIVGEGISRLVFVPGKRFLRGKTAWRERKNDPSRSRNRGRRYPSVCGFVLPPYLHRFDAFQQRVD